MTSAASWTGRPLAVLGRRHGRARPSCGPGEHPGHGGTLCLAGDCGSCVAEVDGVAYVRTCQTPARRRHGRAPAPGRSAHRRCSAGCRPRPARAGGSPPSRSTSPWSAQGDSGRAELAALRAAGGTCSCSTLATARRSSPSTTAPRSSCAVTDDDGRVELVHVHAHEVVLATGAAELQPVCPGNRLRGLLTTSAATTAHAAGVDAARRDRGRRRARWAAGPRGGRAARPPRRRCRRRGRRPRCSTTTASSRPTRAGPSWSASAPRRATSWPASRPTAACASSVRPPRSTTCRRRPSTASSARAPGRRSRTSTACGTAASGELELVKRASLCGTGTCQGTVCLPHLRAYLADRSGAVPEPVHGPAGGPPAHAGRGRRGLPHRRLPPHAAARRAPPPRRPARPLRRLVAAVDLRRRAPRSTRPSARASASATSPPSARWSSPGRTSSRRSSACTRTTCTTSGPGGRATCSC